MNAREEAKAMRKFLENVVQAGLKAEGMPDRFDIEIGNCSYSNDGAVRATFKVAMQAKGTEPREMFNLRQVAEMRGLDLTKVHPEVTLVGYNHKSYKYPYIGTKKGKAGRWKFTERFVEKFWGNSEVEK